ncbi:MAG: hypothetical protein IPK83_15610 [Planctomycetes bacterium]|nr:hypothetical protein [Planctomycetota bacterium]
MRALSRAGAGAAGLSEFESRVVLAPSTNAGSGGAAGGLDTDADTGVSSNEGADGGGSVVIIARDGILNHGTILAEGQNGEAESGNDLGGGGGGGVIIMASTTMISNDGSISASGGNGADSDSNNGPSGGGGGGIVHMIAPEISNDGESVANGGSAGSNETPITDNTMRWAGGGGGSGGGVGGRGGSIPAGDGPVVAGAATAGNAGFVFESQQDPQTILK